MLKSNTTFHGATRAFKAMFWEYVGTLKALEKAKLLGFWTGSSCVPSDLDSWNLKVEIHGSGQARLPGATTCYFTMTIPLYITPEVMAARINTAMAETSYQLE